MRIGFLIPLFLLGGCWEDAIHSNPLDPLSPEYIDAGSIDGIVTDRGFNSISEVIISLTPGGQTATTTTDGRFVFDSVPPGVYTLTASGNGLEAAMSEVTVVANATASVSQTINLLPAVTGVDLTTLHVSRWWPQDDLFRLDARAAVSDGDGLVDVAGVELSIIDIQFSQPLQATTEAGVFELSLTEEDLGGIALHSLLGKPLELVVTDQFGSSATSGPVFLTRIVDFVPETDSPTGSQEIPGGNPLLTWNAADTPFVHTYQIDVFRVDDDVDTNVYMLENVPSSELSVQLSENFAVGQYYWTCSVVDEYGNRSRSKEAGFVVP
ncbi:MAG: carboxypeptidase regulatory-like domain-containing protein [Rhodothermales bacterium]|nr:carboxypeptidase regulatory-like domain-containing protein [Rhodothermales bacterium]